MTVNHTKLKHSLGSATRKREEAISAYVSKKQQLGKDPTYGEFAETSRLRNIMREQFPGGMEELRELAAKKAGSY